MKFVLALLFLSPLSTQAQQVLVAFKPEVPRSYISRTVGNARYIPEIDVYVVDGRLLKALQRNPNVEFVEEDKRIPPADLIPNDPFYPNAWAFPKISAAQAWGITTGTTVIIAVLDTGLDAAHPDIQGKSVSGWNVFNNNSDTSDVHGHGTAVTSVVGANGNNAIGNASVCWGCLIMPIRISDAQGFATYSSMADGIIWALDHSARVANISYHASGSATVSRAAKKMRVAGGLTIVAAGNSGLMETIPNDQYLIVVGATDENDNLAAMSNWGVFIDFTAPIHFTTMCLAGGQYFSCGFEGTSVSSPQVAGAIGLIKTQNPTWSPDQIEAKLKTATDDLGLAGYDSTFGWGRLNLLKAVQ